MTQNYNALATAWASLTDANDFLKLQTLNATVATPQSTDGQGNVTPAVLWPQANGWEGPVNQNDLVPAGIYTDDQRKQFEDTYLGEHL